MGENAVSGNNRKISLGNGGAMQQVVRRMLAAPVKDEQVLETMRACGIRKSEQDYGTAIVMALGLMAAKGDLKAAKLLLDLAGGVEEKPSLGEVTIVDDL